MDTLIVADSVSADSVNSGNEGGTSASSSSSSFKINKSNSIIKSILTNVNTDNYSRPICLTQSMSRSFGSIGSSLSISRQSSSQTRDVVSGGGIPLNGISLIWILNFVAHDHRVRDLLLQSPQMTTSDFATLVVKQV